MPGRSSEFIETVKDFIEDIHHIQLWDSVLGVLMIVFILCLWVSCEMKWIRHVLIRSFFRIEIERRKR